MRKGATAVGVDIGTSTIKIAEIQNVRGAIELINMASAATPPDTVKEGSVVDITAVADTIRGLWKENGFRNRQVSCGIAART